MNTKNQSELNFHDFMNSKEENNREIFSLRTTYEWFRLYEIAKESFAKYGDGSLIPINSLVIDLHTANTSKRPGAFNGFSGNKYYFGGYLEDSANKYYALFEHPISIGEPQDQSNWQCLCVYVSIWWRMFAVIKEG